MLCKGLLLDKEQYSQADLLLCSKGFVEHKTLYEDFKLLRNIHDVVTSKTRLEVRMT